LLLLAPFHIHVTGPDEPAIDEDRKVCGAFVCNDPYIIFDHEIVSCSGVQVSDVDE
jgi:hypothetical protein